MNRALYILCLLIVLSSCGLKTFYKIDPPYNAAMPNPSDGVVVTPFANDEFIFTARDLSDLLTIQISGTDVYYRIYTNQESLQSDAQRINDSNDENTDKGYNQLISLGYEKLDTTEEDENSLIDSNGGRVSISLDNSTENADIRINSVSTGYKPLRSNGNFFCFDSTKGQTNDMFDIPISGDDDYESGTSDGNLYVNLYAVSTGLESFSTQVQSEVLPLGFNYYELK